MPRTRPGWPLLLCVGCLEKNPGFVEPTTGAPELTTTEFATELTHAVAETTDGSDETETVPTSTSNSSTGMIEEPETTTPAPFCGDGELDPGEACDDGNLNELDGCLSDCRVPQCGDGVPEGGEQCDDGNLNELDGCLSDCSFSARRVFVTSKLFNGSMGGLDGADIKCQGLADDARLGAEFRAWLSAGMETPLNRMKPGQGRYVLIDGTVIAHDWAGLLGGDLMHAIDQTEYGQAPPTAVGACLTTAVFTNSRPDGTIGAPADDCMQWTSESPFMPSHFGDSKAANKAWSHACNMPSCASEAPIYCVQQ
jgi:cysteine-rich repeat protein